MVQSVYVLRHAHRFDFDMSRNEWHELAQRSTDPPLSALGQTQASEVGAFFEQLDDESIAHVLSSPYQRCIQTAHPIASALGTTIKVELGLQEIPPSFFRGPAERHRNRVVADVALEERRNYFPLVDSEYCTTITADLAHATDARGIQTRHWLCLQQFMQTPGRESESVVVVTHGWGVPTITAALLGAPLSETAAYFPSTAFGVNAALCSITRLFREDIDGQWELDATLTNSNAHLTDTGEAAAAANAQSDPALSAPFERASRVYYSGHNTPWPLVDDRSLSAKM